MKIFSIFFWILNHYFRTFWKKFFSPLKSQKHLEKFSKKDKKKLPYILVTTHKHCWPHTHIVGRTRTLLAAHTRCRPHMRGVGHTTPLHPYLGWGHDVPLGGGTPLYMKNFYGLELLKNHFYTKKKKWFFAPADPPPYKSEKNHFFYFYFFWKLPLVWKHRNILIVKHKK